METIIFGLIVVVVFFILTAYVLIRNHWTYTEMIEHPGRKFIDNDKILWRFWVWDIERFIIK